MAETAQRAVGAACSRLGTRQYDTGRGNPHFGAVGVRNPQQRLHELDKAYEKEIDRLSELAVKWVILNPEPIAVEKAAYRK